MQQPEYKPFTISPEEALLTAHLEAVGAWLADSTFPAHCEAYEATYREMHPAFIAAGRVFLLYPEPYCLQVEPMEAEGEGSSALMLVRNYLIERRKRNQLLTEKAAYAADKEAQASAPYETPGNAIQQEAYTKTDSQFRFGLAHNEQSLQGMRHSLDQELHANNGRFEILLDKWRLTFFKEPRQ